MKRKITATCLLFCLLQLFCEAQAQIKATGKDFAWLIGNWEGKPGDGDFYENWTKTGPGKFAGNGFMILNSDTVMNEAIRLEKAGKSWAYIVTVDKAKPVVFKLIAKDKNRFVFENKENDFPQQIIYTQLPNGNLLAAIEGVRKGKIVRQEFPLKRVKK